MKPFFPTEAILANDWAKPWISKNYVDWWLFILYHRVAELEEGEIEWRLTEGYQTFSRDDVIQLMSYEGFTLGDYHAKEIMYAKKQIISMHQSEEEEADEIEANLREWENNLQNQLENIESDTRQTNRGKNFSEDTTFREIFESKKSLLYEYICAFQKERITLDIRDYHLEITNQEILERFFVKRELVQFFHDYLKHEEKKIIFELLLKVGLILKKSDSEHLTEKYSDLHGWEEKKAWYKEHYYYSTYYELHEHHQPISYSKAYFDRYIIKKGNDEPESDMGDVSELLGEKNERLRRRKKEKRKSEIKLILDNKKKQKEFSEHYDNMLDPLGYVKLACELKTLLVLEANELDDFDKIACNILRDYLDKFKIPTNHRQDAVKSAHAFSSRYFNNLIQMSKYLDDLQRDFSELQAEQKDYLNNLTMTARQSLNGHLIKNNQIEETKPLKRKVKNKSNFLLHPVIKIIFVSLLIMCLIATTVVTSGIAPGMALLGTFGFAAATPFYGKIACAVGMGIMSIALGLVGGLILERNKCVSVGIFNKKTSKTGLSHRHANDVTSGRFKNSTTTLVKILGHQPVNYSNQDECNRARERIEQWRNNKMQQCDPLTSNSSLSQQESFRYAP